MFTYIPLAETLKSRNKSISEMCSEAGFREGVMRQKLNGSSYITMEELDRICGSLRCQPGDVIGWKEGEGKESRRKVRWDRVSELCAGKGISLPELSEKCRLDRSSLNKARQRNGKVRSWTLGLMCGVLGCTEEDVCDD